MNEAQKVSAAGVIMSAGIGHAVIGGTLVSAEVTGTTIRAINLHKQAGDVGWDIDGNYVCSQFIFNFQTMEVFDGSETYSIDDIYEATAIENTVLIWTKDRNGHKVIKVGDISRGAAICDLIMEMKQGIIYTPDRTERINTVTMRQRMPRFGTFIRFTIRSFIFGLFLTGLLYYFLDQDGTWLWSHTKTNMAVVFLCSMALRFLCTIPRPRWSSANTVRKGN